MSELSDIIKEFEKQYDSNAQPTQDVDTTDADMDLASIIITPDPQDTSIGLSGLLNEFESTYKEPLKTRQDLINQEFDIIKGNIEGNKDILDSNRELLLVKNEQARLDKIEEAKKVEQDKKAEEEGITATSRLGVGLGEFQGQLLVNVLAPMASAIGMEDAAKEMTDAGEVPIETGKAVEKKFKEIYGDDAWNVAQTIGNLAPEAINAVLGIGKNAFQATVGGGLEYARTGSVYEAGKTGLIDFFGGKIADRIFKTGNLSKFGDDIQNLPPDKRDSVNSAIDAMEEAGIDKIDEEARRKILSKIDFSKPSAEVSENLIAEIKVLRDNAYSRVKDAYSTANAAVDTSIKVQIPTFGRSNALFQDIIFDKNAKDALTAINQKIAEESRSGSLDATQIEAITRSLDGYTAKGGGVRVKNIIKAELRKQQEAILPDGQKDVYNNARNLFKDYGTRFTSRISGKGGEIGKSVEDIITTTQAYEVASEILKSGMNPNRAKALNDIGLSESSKMDAVKDVLMKGLNEKKLTENNGISTIVSRYKSSNKDAIQELLGANYSKFDSNMKALEMINNTLQDSPIKEEITQNIINFATNASLVKVSPLYGYKGMAYEGKEIATKVAFRKSGNELKSRINKFVKTKTVANRLTKALNMIMASSASNFSEEKSDDLYPKDFIKTSRNEENPEMIAELMLAADLSNSMPESSSNRGARVAGAITQGSLPPERKTAKELAGTAGASASFVPAVAPSANATEADIMKTQAQVNAFVDGKDGGETKRMVKAYNLMGGRAANNPKNVTKKLDKLPELKEGQDPLEYSLLNTLGFKETDGNFREAFKKSTNQDPVGKRNAWCAKYLNFMLTSAGVDLSKTASAKEIEQNPAYAYSYRNIGKTVFDYAKGKTYAGDDSKIEAGMVVIFSNGYKSKSGKTQSRRSKSGEMFKTNGHAAIVVGYDKKAGTITVLGGNQDSEINVTTYSIDKKIGGFRVLDVDGMPKPDKNTVEALKLFAKKGGSTT